MVIIMHDTELNNLGALPGDEVFNLIVMSAVAIVLQVRQGKSRKIQAGGGAVSARSRKIEAQQGYNGRPASATHVISP
jgi:hypothetical protein